jgi:hypothetical protein
MAPPKKITDSKSFQVTVPKDTFDYLTNLARKGRLGGTESEIGSLLITRTVDEMLRTGYHDLTYRRD